MTNNGKEPLLSTVHWPCNLPTQLQREILTLGKMQSLEENQVFHQPSIDYAIIYVEQGHLNLYSPSDDMDSVLGSVVSHGQWCLTELTQIPHQSLCLMAINSTKIHVFDGQKVNQLISRQPEAQTWLDSCQNECYQRLLHSSLLAIQNKGAHLAHTLITLSKPSHESTNKTQTVSITQSQLSDLLGLRRQSINELLQLFQLHRILKLGRGRINILDRAQLDSIAHGEVSLSLTRTNLNQVIQPGSESSCPIADEKQL